MIGRLFAAVAVIYFAVSAIGWVVMWVVLAGTLPTGPALGIAAAYGIMSAAVAVGAILDARADDRRRQRPSKPFEHSTE